jgi:threonine dehydratase
MSDVILPVSAAEIRAAAARIAPWAHRTPVLTSSTLDTLTGGCLYFKCESFQRMGAFKFRGAANAVFSLDEETARRGVITHSSGNHGQAVALAARLRGIDACVVMPDDAPRVKVEAVRGYGARIVFSDGSPHGRDETMRKIREESGAEFIHPSDDLRVIAGQATCGLELLEDVPDLDLIVTPVGGGGLLSGTALAARYFSASVPVIGAEPAAADDAQKSFRTGTLVASDHPKTVADGLRTSLGSNTFRIVRACVADIATATEDGIVAAMRLIWERMKIVIEPSSAVPLAAIREGGIDVRGKRVGIILSGGNLDLEALPWAKRS